MNYLECCQQYEEPDWAFLVHWEPLRVRAIQREDVVRLDAVVVVLTDVRDFDVREAEAVVVLVAVERGIVVLADGCDSCVVDVSGVMVAVVACCCEVPPLWSAHSESVVCASFVHCPHLVMDLQRMGSCAIVGIATKIRVVINSFFIVYICFLGCSDTPTWKG